MGGYLKEFLNKRSAKIFAGIFFGLAVYALTRDTVDFNNFFMIAREAVYGNVDVYKKFTAFSYPPFFYNIVIMFAQFKLKVALLLWNLMNILLLGFSIAMILKLCYPEKTFFRYDSKSWIKLFLPIALAFGFILENIQLGQSNILAFFLCVTAVYLLEEKHDIPAGILIAAATAIKLTPMFFVVYFIYRFKYKAVLGFAVGFLLFFLLIPSLFYGFGRAWSLSYSCLSGTIFPFLSNDAIIRETVYYTHPNQSLDAFFIRHFTELGKVNYGGLHNYLDPAKFSLETMKRFGVFFKFALLIITGLILRRTNKTRLVSKFEYAIVFFLILYISPSSWIAHYISAIFAYFVVIAYITDIYADRIGKLLLSAAMVVCIAFTYTGVTSNLQSYSGVFVGHFILFVTMLFVCFKESHRKAL